MSIGVMKDQKIKLRDLHVSDTLGSSGFRGGLEHLKRETRLIDEIFRAKTIRHLNPVITHFGSPLQIHTR